jgi:hypothetical protein
VKKKRVLPAHIIICTFFSIVFIVIMLCFKGTIMEEFCRQLRYLPLLQKYALKAHIRLLCGGKWPEEPIIERDTKTVVVSVVSFYALRVTPKALKSLY